MNPVRAKVIASALGAALSFVVVAIADIDTQLGQNIGDWVEAAIVIVSTFGAGYMKRETVASSSPPPASPR